MSLTREAYFERKWRHLPRLAEAVGHLPNERNDRLSSIERSSVEATGDAIDIAELVVQHGDQIRKAAQGQAWNADEFHHELDVLEQILKDISEWFAEMAIEVRACHREIE